MKYLKKIQIKIVLHSWKHNTGLLCMFYLFITIFGYFYKVDQLDKISQLKVNILLLYSAQI